MGAREDRTRGGRQGRPQSVTFIDRDISFQPMSAAPARLRRSQRAPAKVDFEDGLEVAPGHRGLDGVGMLGQGCPCQAGKVSGCSQTPVSEGALRSGFILFLFLLFLTFAEAQRKTTKMPHSLFPFLHLLARALHFSFGCRPVPSKCHIWLSPYAGAPIHTKPLLLGLSLSPISCQLHPPFSGLWDGRQLAALRGVI